MDEEEVFGLLTACSNEGRWGREDERGTLNFVSPSSRVRAAQLITEGRIVSLGRRLRATPAGDGQEPVSQAMLDAGENAGITCMDQFTIACHGLEVTHIDAIGHMFLNGQLYNGRRVAACVTPTGLDFADVSALGPLFTRGVLLDVAGARSVPCLEAGYGVTPDDLVAAERLAGVTVGRGDAIFVHAGTERRQPGPDGEAMGLRAGVTPSCLPWFFEREIAVYSGDCTEQLPSGYDRVPYPLHQIGFVAMGLVLLDNPSMGELVATCTELGRYSFALSVAPLPLPRATGSPANPVALF